MGSCATTHSHTLPKIGAYMTAFPTSGFLAEASDGLRKMLSAQATEISLSQVKYFLNKATRATLSTPFWKAR